jgi:hypothetical protein
LIVKEKLEKFFERLALEEDEDFMLPGSSSEINEEGHQVLVIQSSL